MCECRDILQAIALRRIIAYRGRISYSPQVSSAQNKPFPLILASIHATRKTISRSVELFKPTCEDSLLISLVRISHCLNKHPSLNLRNTRGRDGFLGY